MKTTSPVVDDLDEVDPDGIEGELMCHPTSISREGGL